MSSPSQETEDEKLVDAGDTESQNEAAAITEAQPSQLEELPEPDWPQEVSSPTDDIEDVELCRVILSSLPHPRTEEAVPALLGLASALLSQFASREDPYDLDESLFHLRDARALCPENHPNRVSVLVKLSYTFNRLHDSMGSREYLDESITLGREALQTIHPHHRLREQLFTTLMESLVRRYELSAKEEDLEEAVNLGCEAIVLYSRGSTHTARAVGAFGMALGRKYNVSQDFEDLQESISCSREALSLSPASNAFHGLLSINLSKMLIARFEILSDFDDLVDAIAQGQKSIQLLPNVHPMRPFALGNLGQLLLRRCTFIQQGEDSSEAFSFLRDSLSLFPQNHPLRQEIFLSSCELVGAWPDGLTVADLAESIKLITESLPSFTNEPQAQSIIQSGLSSAIHRLYNSLTIGSPDQASISEKLVEDLRVALLLFPEEHQDLPRLLLSVGRALFELYMSTSNLDNLDEALLYLERAAPLHQSGFMKGEYFEQYFNCLVERFNLRGNIQDLAYATDLCRETLGPDGCFAGDDDRAGRLANLGNLLLMKFTRTANNSDLEEAIIYSREAREGIRGFEDEDSAFILVNLADALSLRSEMAGVSVGRSALDEAISLCRETFQLLPMDSPARCHPLMTIAMALVRRYVFLGETEDLEEAIVHSREASQYTFSGQPSRRWLVLNNFAAALIARYEISTDPGDLEEAETLLKEVLLILPESHLNRSGALLHLGRIFQLQHKGVATFNKLTESFTYLQEALPAYPKGHPDRAMLLFSLGSGYMLRFFSYENKEDLASAADCLREALTLLPRGHLARGRVLSGLAQIITITETPFSGEEIKAYALESIEESGSPLVPRFDSAVTWAHRGADASFRIDCYAQALDLFQQVLLINPDIDKQVQRFAKIPEARHLGVDAAGEAIAMGRLEQAVSLLEQGRSIILEGLQRFRTPTDKLREAAPEYAETLQSLLEQMERISLLATSEHAKPDAAMHDHILNHQNRLQLEWEKTLANIRELEGFKTFLLPQEFTQLQLAAAEGPVIILNACEKRCDALLVFATGTPKLVPLQGVSLASLSDLYRRLYAARMLHRRKPSAAKFYRSTLREVLRSLWYFVALPVITALSSAGFNLRNQRIWWCPTSYFALLPLHAAGAYLTQQPNLPDLYISSYTPSLSSLIRARNSAPISQGPAVPKLLLVGHKGSRGELHKVDEELRLISGVKGVGVYQLAGDGATPRTVLDGMHKFPWVHLSCHGWVKNERPFESYFQLDQEQPLKVYDIVNARIPDAELAFLSACHSASAGSSFPDETIHLASALQFAGFKSVVGTMWEMFDSEGPELAKIFYKELVKSEMGHKGSAIALSKAIRKFSRKNPDKGPERLVMFVHIGA